MPLVYLNRLKKVPAEKMLENSPILSAYASLRLKVRGGIRKKVFIFWIPL